MASCFFGQESGKLKRCADISIFEIRVIVQNLLSRSTCGEQVKNVANTNSQPTNYGFSAKDFRIAGNAVQFAHRLFSCRASHEVTKCSTFYDHMIDQIRVRLLEDPWTQSA